MNRLAEMGYEHTQKAPLHYLLYGVVAVLLVCAWFNRNDQAAIVILLSIAVALIVVSFMFQRMTVRDEGEYLAIRYGPLPVFGARLPYAAIASAERDRTSVLDGWGIHYIPGRGTTYNLWGFDCVKVVAGGRVIRIGSDDASNLLDFLRERIAQEAEDTPLESV